MVIFNKKNLKGMSAIVATMLLLVVVAVGVTGFNKWYSSFNSGLTANADSDAAVALKETDIELISGDQLYFNHEYNSNVNVKSIKIGGKVCNVSSMNLSAGVTNFSLNNCTTGMNEGFYEVVIVTGDEVISKVMDVNPPKIFLVSLSSNNYSVDYLGQINLSWTTSGMKNCSGSLNWSGVKSKVGSQIISNMKSNSIFNLVCDKNGGGTMNSSVLINVSPPCFLLTSGTPVYLISTCCDLHKMRFNLNGNYQLANDVDCSDTINWTWANGTGFSPIGNISISAPNERFYGNLNGNHYKISNIFMNISATPTYGQMGLFSQTSGMISNLTIDKANFTFYSGGSLNRYAIFSAYILGGPVNNLTISNSNLKVTSSATGSGGITGEVGNDFVTINNSRVINSNLTGVYAGLIGRLGNSQDYPNIILDRSYIDGVIINTPSSERISGLVYGMEDGKVLNSYSKNCIINGSNYVAGIVGYISPGGSNSPNLTINNTYSNCSLYSTSYVGGILGITENNGINYIENSYFSGYIYSNVPSNRAGIISAITGTNPTYQKNNYWDNQSSTVSTTAGGGGGLAEGKTTAQMKQQATFVNWNFTNTWTTNGDTTYPKFKWE